VARSPHDRLRRHYASLAGRYATVDRRADYARLVVPNGNDGEPFHRWFHLKEAYSSKLLGRVAKDDGLAEKERLLLLDPFSGGATTLLSGMLGSPGWSGTATGIGVERNPFLRFVAATKVTAAGADGPATATAVSKAAAEVSAAAKAPGRWPTVPNLTTLRNPLHYPPATVGRLMRMRRAAEALDGGLVRDLVLLCIATALEPAGYLRRDGRALRYDPSRTPLDPQVAFSNRIAAVTADLTSNRPSESSGRVREGDARELAGCEDASGFDLALFSPPYPNNIDYTEVYKTEGWLLGLYEDADAFRAQRLSTLRSHPSVRFPNTFAYTERPDADEVESLVEPLVAAIPVDRYAVGRAQMMRGYVDDMLQVFLRCAELAGPESRLVFVVGNSAHGSGGDRFEVAADLLLARAAELAGWRVEEIRVARDLARRGPGSELLRESAVSLRAR
jgi:hypothetical protein